MAAANLVLFFGLLFAPPMMMEREVGMKQKHKTQKHRTQKE
jgi:hypothetical protein